MTELSEVKFPELCPKCGKKLFLDWGWHQCPDHGKVEKAVKPHYRVLELSDLRKKIEL